MDISPGRGNDTGLPGVVIGKELALNLGLVLFDTVEILLPMGIPTPMGVVPRLRNSALLVSSNQFV